MAVPYISSAEVIQATGGFHVINEIGEGGFGKVYRCMLHHTPVAIKVMDAGGLQGQEQFDNEVALLSRLSHPALVRLLYVVQEPALKCLIYELMPGGNMESALVADPASNPGSPTHRNNSTSSSSSGAVKRGVPWWGRIKVAAQVSGALAYLHAPGPGRTPLVHADLKPANVFLDAALNAKLGDLGLALVAGTRSSSSQRGGGGGDTAVGTWSYLAPEYRSGGAGLSPATDMYAWGVSLVQILTGDFSQGDKVLARARDAAARSQLAALCDPAAGAWDLGAGCRALRLALWAAADKPDARPSAAVLAQQMEELWEAVQAALDRSGTAAAAGSIRPP